MWTMQKVDVEVPTYKLGSDVRARAGLIARGLGLGLRGSGCRQHQARAGGMGLGLAGPGLGLSPGFLVVKFHTVSERQERSSRHSPVHSKNFIDVDRLNNRIFHRCPHINTLS